MKILIVYLIVSALQISANAADDFKYAPPSIRLSGKKYVPLDIQVSVVKWTVGENLRDVRAHAEVLVGIREQGFPFLLLNPGAQVTIKELGQPVPIQRMEGPLFKNSNFFALQTDLKPGTYTLIFDYAFQHDSEMSHFLPLRYPEHKFVEMGIPCNMQFDHFPLTLDISFEGRAPVQIISNGNLTKKAAGDYRLTFPTFFTSMAFYIDIVSTSQMVFKATDLKSINGKKVKLLTYSTKDDSGKQWVSTFSDLLTYSFKVLEGRLGPYPYRSIILKSTDKKGGGAYAGAMAFNEIYLEHITHELSHSWWMQNIWAAHGNDMWIFEGLGNWAPLYRTGFEFDLNYKGFIDVASNPYTLTQTYSAHASGTTLLAAIDRRLKDKKKEGMLPILKKMFVLKSGQSITTAEFQLLVEKISGENLSDLFSYYVKFP